ncbi:MAG: F0F1 ATP synthase subunit A [Clostridia bacterium]|nr:F0F1 ATP synthase subunit A [Clostridia bacterium]
MNTKSLRFKITDAFYIAMMIIPIVFGIVLKVVTTPPSEGISITGALVYFSIPMPLQDFLITESQVNSAIAFIVILFFCLYITHGLSEKAELKRQHIAEFIVEKVAALVEENMGDYFKGFTPFIIAILALSGVSSLLTLFGLYPPTSDINIVGGWAVLVFILITYYKMKCGPLHYLKAFGDPVPFLAPLNIISEVATPLSMAFRHYGNVLSGSVISVLLGAALGGLSSMVLGWLPGFLADIPLFRIGIPAVLSVYFDIFSGCLQAFIFAMLTMLYVAGGFPLEEYMNRKAKKEKTRKCVTNK